MTAQATVAAAENRKTNAPIRRIARLNKSKNATATIMTTTIITAMTMTLMPIKKAAVSEREEKKA